MDCGLSSAEVPQYTGTIPGMNRHQVSWWLWAVGTVLIALSWFDVVSSKVGWCGFGIGMLGSVLGWGLRPPGRDVDGGKADSKGGED
jgi:hypothetical protein